MFPSMLFRSWAAVHSTAPAVSLLTVVAASSFLLRASALPKIAFAWFPNAIPAMLLLPAVSGIAVAIACNNSARLPIPDRAQAKVARAAWVSTLTVIALAASNAGHLGSGNAEALAVARNVVFYAALALLALRLGYPQVAWLPPLLYTLCCMLFGYGGGVGSDYYWWALVMEVNASSTQTALAATIFILAAALYVATPAKSADRRGQE